MITPNATYRQTKRVVDPVEGTYQTVLTIDTSVGQSDNVGTYNCTVENTRGISSTTVVVSANGELIQECIHIADEVCMVLTEDRSCGLTHLDLLFYKTMWLAVHACMFIYSAGVCHCWWKSYSWTAVHSDL